ncbi:MAG: hypothetical protein JKY56_06655, partial [Kofleriaceae bacterium]|nr:hypothetical protein [Kofleriaceae bacterium]
AAKAREALNAEAKENVARVRAEKREGEQRVRVQRLATAKREAEAREAQERKRAEQATARAAEQTRLAATREVARKRAAQAAKKEKEARLQAEARAKEARKVAKAAEELEAEARRQSEEAMAARTVAVAAAAKEAVLRRNAQARETEQRRRAQQAEAKERATRKLAAAREAKALRVAKAAALREAAARKRAKEAAAREAVARKQAEDRDAEEKRKAQRIAAREATARKAAEKIAAREAAARVAAEKIAAREAAARIAAEKREAVQRARAEALAAKAVVAQEKANKREEKLRQAIKKAEAKQVEANRRREAQRLVQRKAATERVAAQRKEASRQAAAKRAEAARALAERARVGEERREAAVLKARLQREKKSASKINTVKIDQLELACEAKHWWSCETAGMRLRDGDGVAADPQRALGFLERACLGGSSSACRAALPLLASKSSPEQSRLVQLRTAACTNGAGNAGACERAATTLLKAKNKKGRAQAAALALRGCELKSSRACAIAGDIAIESPVDRDEAAALYDRACSPGGREGCAGLASLCRKGFLSACERLIGKIQKEQVPAKSVLAKAATLRRSGDDLGAAQVLLLAIREETTPRIQAELGLAFQGSGKFAEAERYLAKSLDTTDSWIDAHRPGLERILTHAKSRLGWIVLKCNSGDEEGLVAGVKVRCDRPLRIAVGEHIVEVRAPNRLSSMVTANVVQNSRAMVRATLEVHHCEKPGMLHMAGTEGGCCWPGQRWTSGTCSGESTNGAMASISSASASSSGSGGLAPLRIRLLGGVTNFVGSSLFRSGVNASAESTSFGPRGELRVGLHLASSFTLEAIMGGSRKSFSHWGDCNGGTSDCASAFPFTDTIDFGAMLQMHTNPTRDGGNLDLHVGVGVRPWTRIELDGAGGPVKLTSTVVPGELGASLFLGSRVSLDVLGQGELWLPWKYCDTDCVGSKSVQTAFAWSALGGLTVHID